MERERWTKIVSRASCKIRDKGTWVYYIRVLMDKYKLQEFWGDNRWEEKVWKTRAIGQIEQESEKAWRKEVEDKEDIGLYTDRQAALARADYMEKSSGDEIR